MVAEAADTSANLMRECSEGISMEAWEKQTSASAKTSASHTNKKQVEYSHNHSTASCRREQTVHHAVNEDAPENQFVRCWPAGSRPSKGSSMEVPYRILLRIPP